MEMVLSLSKDVRAFIASVATGSLAYGMFMFVVGMWVFETTGSYAKFAVIVVCAELPNILLLPMSGALVDRHRRKDVLFYSDVASALIGVMFASLALVSLPSLPVAGLFYFALVAIRDMYAAASFASVTRLTDVTQRSVVNGYQESAGALAAIISPALGATLFSKAGLPATLFACAAIFMCSIAIRWKVRIDDQNAPAAATGVAIRKRLWSSLRDQYLSGFRAIWRDAELRRLAVFFTAVNIGASVYVLVNRPYLLSFTSPTFVGYFVSTIGVGAVASIAIVKALHHVNNKILIIGMSCVSVGFVKIFVGFTREPAVLIALAFCYGFLVPLINGTNQTIWQAAVPEPLQGRVFAARRVITAGIKPLTGLLSISLVAGLTNILSAQIGGISLATVWGSDKAAPLGLLDSICGVVIVLSVVILRRPAVHIRTEGDSVGSDASIKT